MPARILLTGASGFVGTHLRVALATRFAEADIIGVGAAPDTPAASHVLSLDLTDRKATDALIAEVKPDMVIHLAAQASVARSARDDGATWAVNVGGALNLATALARHAADATVLAVSTGEVYGASFLNSPVGETSPLVPLNPYAKSKALAERVFADILPPNARLIVARPFNHTGPGQREDFVLPSFAGQVARMEAGLQAPRMAVGNLDVARDFLDVRDVVEAYVALVVRAADLPTRFVVNIASGKAWRLRELLDMLQRMARVAFEIDVDPARLRPADLPVAMGDAGLLRAVTGWSPNFDIEATLEGLLEAARARA